jgi:hypothetical protein
MQYTPEELGNLLRDTKLPDRAAAAAALRIKLINRRIRVIVVSVGLTEKDVLSLGFEYADNLQRTVDRILEQCNEKLQITVFTHGGDTYPEIGVSAG